MPLEVVRNEWSEIPVRNIYGYVEYTRTDAFIEKAAEYLSYHLDTSKIDVNYKFDFIEEFKKAMKGEQSYDRQREIQSRG